MKTDEQKAVEAAFAAGKNVDYKFKEDTEWSRVSFVPCWNWKDFDYRIAPEEPAPCGFQVGKTYQTRENGARIVVMIDDDAEKPILVAEVGSDGRAASGSMLTRRGPDGKDFRNVKYDGYDLILPAAKKRVPLSADDVPDDAVFLSPSGMKIWPNKVDSSGVLVTVFESGPSLYPWGAILKWQYRSATTTGGEWTGCWKEAEQ